MPLYEVEITFMVQAKDAGAAARELSGELDGITGVFITDYYVGGVEEI